MKGKKLLRKKSSQLYREKNCMNYITAVTLFASLLLNSFSANAKKPGKDHYYDIHFATFKDKYYKRGTADKVYVPSVSDKINNLKEIIDSGVSIETKSGWGRTPLQVAIIHGQCDVAEFLIEKGANIHTKDKFGRSLMGSAVQTGNIKTVKFLLRYVNKEQINSVVTYAKERRKILQSNDKKYIRQEYYISDYGAPCDRERWLSRKNPCWHGIEEEDIINDKKVLDEILIILKKSLSQKTPVKSKKNLKPNDANGGKVKSSSPPKKNK